ncbi:flavin reductase family protein [Desulfogranum japonicum]|uniref:flavin reductase family protein n=1 Tax=Desulfogranum japonicum TaxID=231447 RepID=UPI00041D8F4B|nr:flavin reductase family protein [Desulfogranum japonicum]
MKPIGPTNALYPMPTTLVGVTVDSKPNFLAVAHVGIMNHGTPQYLSVGLNKDHYSNSGIHENKTFSICLPSENLMKKTDYCGIMTGKKTDKAALFDVFFGKLKTAPMIHECPVNMELKLQDVLSLGKHEIFIGELVQTYADDSVITEGNINIAKLSPLLFDMASKKYWALGEPLGDCWNIGKELKNN